jgi:hypothetical protein
MPIAQAVGLLCSLFALEEDREQKRGENANDGQHNQQLYQGEARTAPRGWRNERSRSVRHAI